AAPLVIGDTMYVVTPYPNYVYAFDLKQPNAAVVKWKFDPKPQASAQGVACCDVVNRGAAYADGRLFINTLDAHTIAIDAATGRELWRTKLGDISRRETMTMAPLAVKDKVIVGNSGGDLGVRGRLTALDAAKGPTALPASTTSTITTASTRTCCLSCRSAADSARCSCTPIATATCTCSTARRDRCCRPIRT